MTVQELIIELSKYPRDMKITRVNSVFENADGELTLTHKDTPEEIELSKKREEEWEDEWNRRHKEMLDRRGEITCFADRW